MSQVRQSVEWSYAQVIEHFPMVDFKARLSIHKSPVGMFYMVAAILTNCVTIFRHGNTNSTFFDMQPPRIDEYLASIAMEQEE